MLNELQVKTGFEDMNLPLIHHQLSTDAYWCIGIPLETVEAAWRSSFCIGLFIEAEMIGFARIITDYATFGYLADVYILTEHRGKGYSKEMMAYIMELPWVKGLRRFMLATLDAHSLYEQFGFIAPRKPDRLMEIIQPGVYGDRNNKIV